MASTKTLPQGHYALHAYVRQGEVLRFEPPHSRVTFPYIYQNRPRHARYAIAGHYSVVLHGDEFLVWDLHEALKGQPNDGWVLPPKPRLVHDDLDAAIMATLILYDTEPPSCNSV